MTSKLFDPVSGEPIGVVDDAGTKRIQVESKAASGGYGGQVEGRAADGASSVGNPVLVGGVDGSTVRFVNVDSLGRVVVVGPGTAGTPSGGVVSVQGVSGGTVLPVSDGGGSLTIDGTVTGNQGTPGSHANRWMVGLSDGSTFISPATDRSTAGAPFSVRLSDGTTFYIGPSTSQFPSSLVGGRLDTNTGSWLGSTAPTVGQKTMANSLPVVVASDNGLALDATLTGGTQTTRVTDGTSTAAVKAASTAAVASDPALVVAVSPNNTVATTNASASQVDGHSSTLGATTDADSANTVIGRLKQIITRLAGGLPSALVGGRLDSNIGSWLGSTTPTVGQKTSANSLPTVIASDQSTLPISMASGGYGGQVEGRAADGASAVGNPVLVGGIDGSTARSVAVDLLGRIITAPAGSSSDVTPGLAPGYVATAALTRVAVRSTAYTEQTSNAQRSIVSANANDTAAGTGARTVLLKYYTSTWTGPFEETITLNGTVAVNTVSTTICYIEKMEVLTVGSTGSNVGIISLRTTTGGGGSTFASIAATDNETFYTHHYVATGVTCYVTGISVGHNGTVVGSGGLFIVRAQALNVANSVENQIGDFVRLYGQSSTISRVWGTALEVVGPARISVYVTPESSSALIYRSSIDFYDQ